MASTTARTTPARRRPWSAIEAAGGTAVAIAGDVTDPASPDALLGELEERFGPVLALVNNAGITADALSMRIADGDWDVRSRDQPLRRLSDDPEGAAAR